MRIILFTGKGGVGKTSLAAATALNCAERGQKTLVMSTDAAHSLADSLGQDLPGEPLEVLPNLFAQEINVQEELRKNWGVIQDFLVHFLKSQGFDDVVAEEFAVFPGMEDLFSLLRIRAYEQEGNFDTLVVDCAPTGNTIRMLSIPDIFRWYMEKIFKVERRLVPTLKPLAERLLKVPFPNRDFYDHVEILYQQLMATHSLLCDARKSCVRIVCNLEKMSLKESQRAFAYLHLFGFPVDAVFLNKVLPPEAHVDYFAKWHALQLQYKEEAKNSFHPLKIFETPLYETEVVGPDSLRNMAQETYRGEDPARVFSDGQGLTVKKNAKGYLLTLPLPFTDKKEVDLWVNGNEMSIRINNYQRNLFLPRVCRELFPQKAKLDKGILAVQFSPATRST